MRIKYEVLSGFKNIDRSTEPTYFTVLGEQVGKTIVPLQATGKLHLLSGTKKLPEVLAIIQNEDAAGSLVGRLVLVALLVIFAYGSTGSFDAHH